MIIDRTCDMVDWAAVWRARMEANRRLKGGTECAGLWQERRAAERYDMIVKKESRAKALAMIQMLQLGQGQKVLDIGAGPGTHTIPMAKIVGQVTAIEPSPGMADVLEHNLAEENIRNVNCVRKRWEDVVPSDLYSPYDIVLASLSLGMLDIRAALEKMDRACSGRVYLVWPAGVTAWERIYREAWPQIHAEPYVSGPKADVLFNVLYQMGICPDIHIYRDEHVEMFSGLDEAVAYYRSMYCATTQEKESSLRRFLGRKLNRSTDGLTLRGVSQMALLSWDVMINRMQG